MEDDYSHSERETLDFIKDADLSDSINITSSVILPTQDQEFEEPPSPAIKNDRTQIKICFIQAKEGDIKKQYEFKRKLGSGGFSTVFLARNKETNDEVAIKSVDKSKINKEE